MTQSGRVRSKDESKRAGHGEGTRSQENKRMRARESGGAGGNENGHEMGALGDEGLGGEPPSAPRLTHVKVICWAGPGEGCVKSLSTKCQTQDREIDPQAQADMRHCHLSGKAQSSSHIRIAANSP